MILYGRLPKRRSCNRKVRVLATAPLTALVRVPMQNIRCSNEQRLMVASASDPTAAATKKARDHSRAYILSKTEGLYFLSTIFLVERYLPLLILYW